MELDNERFLSPGELKEDFVIKSLRPTSLEEYIGQKNVKERLQIAIEAARVRREPLDHVLLAGPPGLGKTTLSHIIANEMGTNIYITSGPVIEKQGDLAAILTGLEHGDVLFIDEIHRLGRAMDIMIGKGPSARSIRLDINPFTLVGATTRSGLIGAPLRNRFGMVLEMEFYQILELEEIIERSAKLLDVGIEGKATKLLAMRSRGTPRIANRLLRRVRDFATVDGSNKITVEMVTRAMEVMGIDAEGLDEMDRKILRIVEPETISEVYEPYLLQAGFLVRTQRGRAVTEKTYKHLGLKSKHNGSLFGEM